MSNKEQCISLLNSFSDSQLVNIIAILKAAKAAISEAEDDAFCENLYKQYEADEEKEEEYSETVVLEELKIKLCLC